MNDQTDSQLLAEWAKTRAEPAFAELVRRHVDFVHSAAVRMVCDSHLAQDVTQSVFVALARDAAQLTDRRVLAGWLHRTAQNIAAQTVRTDVRRRAREQEAAAMNQLLADSGTGVPPVWSEIAPQLDAALGELPEPDRDAVLLRYFENKSLREVGQALGTSDDTAQKRVSRAVERLREFLAKRGVTVGTSGLAVVISANAVQAAPVGLAVTISTAAALAGTTIASTATATAIKTIAITTLQKTIIGATLAAAVGTGIYEARHASTLRNQNETLRQQQASFNEQIQRLNRTLTDATNQIAALLEDNKRLNRNTSELLRLRGELGVLKRELSQPDRVQDLGNHMGSNDLEIATALVTHVNQLKQFLAEHPNEQFPEASLAHYFQWLRATSHSLDTEEQLRAARNSLRVSALHNFGGLTLMAIQKYSKTNGGRFPSDLSELRPYFDLTIGDEMLNRYQIVEAKNIDRLKYSVDADGLVITQKTLADENEPPLFIGAQSYYLGKN